MLLRSALRQSKRSLLKQQPARCMSSSSLPTSRSPMFPDDQQDKLLFTPGPLSTSWTVKQAATRDLGSRDTAFIKVIQEVRSGCLDLANVSPDEFTMVPIQGSGTFGVEACLSSAVPKGKTLLILANGSYGLRMGAMAKAHGIEHIIHETPDDTYPDASKLAAELKNNPNISHVAVVQSETTSGIVNDVESLGQIVNEHGRSFIVDAMSSFGAVPVDFAKGKIDYLITSSNKCVEGIPGFSVNIARKSELNKCKDNATSLSLDVFAQNAGLDKDGQFRFTPPTHALLAFHQALKEMKQEGGVPGRSARYQANQAALQKGMDDLGFELYLPKEKQGYIISSYRYPTDANWDFTTFYSKLNDRGYVIYPGKVSKADCFRIGHIGRLFPSDTEGLVAAMDEVCQEMKTAKYA